MTKWLDSRTNCCYNSPADIPTYKNCHHIEAEVGLYKKERCVKYLTSEDVTTVIQKLQDVTSVLIRATFTNLEATWSLNTLVIDIL